MLPLLSLSLSLSAERGNAYDDDCYGRPDVADKKRLFEVRGNSGRGHSQTKASLHERLFSLRNTHYYYTGWGKCTIIAHTRTLLFITALCSTGSRAEEEKKLICRLPIGGPLTGPKFGASLSWGGDLSLSRIVCDPVRLFLLKFNPLPRRR